VKLNILINLILIIPKVEYLTFIVLQNIGRSIYINILKNKALNPIIVHKNGD
jgi:hypothetical protein